MNRDIIILAEALTMAGGVRVIGEIANRLSARNWNVEIWTLQRREDFSWFRLSGQVQVVSFFRTGTLADYDKLCLALKLHRGRRVMATFWRTAAAIISEQAFEPGLGYYLVQDIETVYASQKKISDLVMSTYAGGLKMVTTSRWVEKNLPGCHYIGIGISPLYTRPKNVKRLGDVIAMLRKNALKGFDRLMEYNRFLTTRGLSLNFVGAGQLDAAFAFVPVNYLGYPKDSQMPGVLASHSVFVSTSRHEGFGLPRLEAMACGVPVVTTPDGGSDEYCVHGENCFISNDMEYLAQQTAEIVSSPKLSQRLAEAGIETARRYQWSDVIDRLETHLTQ